MGDHRADIKIELTFPDGKKHVMDAWVNYWPDDESGVDYRVKEFFSKAWEEWLWEYRATERKAAEKEHERVERQQLAALKAKYEAEPGKPA